MRRLLFLAALCIFTVGISHASTQDDINRILAEEDAPFGVVFEIGGSDGNALQWAIPAVNEYVKQLRKRFPDIGLAVVSHGNEEFGLLKSAQKTNAKIQKTVQSLVASDVPVHVCGTNASWHDKAAKDFPDYVDVAPAGPTEVRNYQAMGYALVKVKKP